MKSYRPASRAPTSGGADLLTDTFVILVLRENTEPASRITSAGIQDLFPVGRRKRRVTCVHHGNPAALHVFKPPSVARIEQRFPAPRRSREESVLSPEAGGAGRAGGRAWTRPSLDLWSACTVFLDRAPTLRSLDGWRLIEPVLKA